MGSKTDLAGADVLELLSDSESSVLRSMGIEEMSIKEISSASRLDEASVSRSLLYLENKGLISSTRQKVSTCLLSEDGNRYYNNEFPEEHVLKCIAEKGEIPLSSLADSTGVTRNEAAAALGMLKGASLIKIESAAKGASVSAIASGDALFARRRAEIARLLSGESSDNAIKAELMKRGIISVQTRTDTYASLTKAGETVKARLANESTREKIIDTLTTSMIKNGSWRGSRFKKYDIKSPVPSLTGGREHPLKWLERVSREIFVGMGFKEMSGNWVESAFWNMDSMFIPQNHPSRDVQDTFYIPGSANMKRSELTELVKQVHERGLDTGSTGYVMDWKLEEASKLVLRSHTTAVTYRMFASGIRPPAKYFSIGRVFRNETIDRMHLAEFHQIEGFVTAENLSIGNLKAYLQEFYRQFGIRNLKFRPTYNPYTEPSIEVYAHHGGLNKWVEIGNSGIFRPEAQRPYGLKTQTVAWGLALERLASFLFESSDIRQLLGNEVDLGFIRGYPYRELKF